MFATAVFATAVFAIAVFAIACCVGSAKAEGPYVASRIRADATAAKRPAAAMRIGSLDAAARRQESARGDAASVSASRPLVQRGLTPAGGLTVQLDGRFTTQVVVEANGSESGALCGDRTVPDGH
jgi:hypothetical protein